MAEYGVPMTLTTPRGVVTFNAIGGDRYLLSDISGLDMPNIRTVGEPLPQRDGVAVYDSFFGARTPVLAGQIVPASGSTTTRREMEDYLRSCLRSLVNGSGVLSWDPEGYAYTAPRTLAYADVAYADSAEVY